MLMSDIKGRVNAYAARPSVFKVKDRSDPITDAYTGHICSATQSGRFEYVIFRN